MHCFHFYVVFTYFAMFWLSRGPELVGTPSTSEYIFRYSSIIIFMIMRCLKIVPLSFFYKQRRDKLHWRTNGSFFWQTTSTSLQLLTSPGNPFQLLFQNSMDSGLLDIDNAEAYSVKSGGKDLADFDRLIQFSWQQKMDEGAFRYPFQHPQCKKLLGNYNYLAQYNSFRVIDHLD